MELRAETVATRIYALGGILLMVWIYVICLVLLVGAETDRALEAPAIEARTG